MFDASDDRSFDQLDIAFAARLEPIYLAPESGLTSIQPAAVQKHRAADLPVLLLPLRFRLLQDADGDEAANSPIPPKHTVFLVQVPKGGGWHLQDEI